MRAVFLGYLLATAIFAGCDRPAQAKRDTATATASATAAATGSALGKQAAAATNVVLVANLAEADEECGCGQIIRAVREAGKSGVAVREIDTRSAKDEAQKYKALVTPTVVVFDGDKELRRYEGESDDVAAKVKADLATLGKK